MRLRAAALACVLAVAFASFFTAIDWGLPSALSDETVQSWAFDTIAPVAPLNEAYHGFTREGNEWITYPLFHYVVLDVVYAPYLAWQWLTGGIGSPTAEFPYGLEDPTATLPRLVLIARMVSLAMGLGVIALVYLITERLLSRAAAFWAALSAALLPLLAYYAKVSNLDVPYAFWVFLAVWQYVRILETGATRHFVLFGVCGALAIATKDQAYGFFVLAAPLLMYIAARRAEPQGVTPRALARAAISKPILAAGIATVVTYALANNLPFGGWNGWMRHMTFGGALFDNRLERGGELGTLGAYFGTLTETVRALASLLGPGSLLLAAGGIVLAIRERRWPALGLLVFAGSYLIFCIILWDAALLRYLLVPALMLCPFAGWAIARIAALRGVARWAAAAFALYALGWQVFMVAHTNLMLLRDSRYPMAEWIERNVAEPGRVEIYTAPRYLPTLPSRMKLKLTGNPRDLITGRLEAAAFTASALHARAPDYILILKDTGITGDPDTWREHAGMREYFRALSGGTLGYDLLVEIPSGGLADARQIPGTRPTSLLFKRRCTALAPVNEPAVQCARRSADRAAPTPRAPQ